MKKDDDFYEVMPYAQGTPFRDDLLEDTNEYQELLEEDQLEARSRRMAIITLVFVVMASLAFIVVVMRGLQLLQDAAGL